MAATRRRIYAEEGPEWALHTIDQLRLAVEQARVNLTCATTPESLEVLTNELEAAQADLSHHVYVAKVRSLGRAEADRQRRDGLAFQRWLLRKGKRR